MKKPPPSIQKRMQSLHDFDQAAKAFPGPVTVTFRDKDGNPRQLRIGDPVVKAPLLRAARQAAYTEFARLSGRYEQ